MGDGGPRAGEPGGGRRAGQRRSLRIGSPLARVHPPLRLNGGAGVKAIEEENGPCLIEAACKQSHLSGEDSKSPTAAGNYNYV